MLKALALGANAVIFPELIAAAADVAGKATLASIDTSIVRQTWP